MSTATKARISGLSPGKSSRSLGRRIIMNYQLYLFLLPAVVWYIVFQYVPMYGIQVAFKDFNGAFGIMGSPWVGLKHFRSFFNSYYIVPLLRNTIVLSLYSLAAGFPLPIVLALMLKEVNNNRYRRFIQTVTYAPHFISTVVLVGMIRLMLSPTYGIVNTFLEALGFEARNFMAISSMFRHIYVWSGVWKDIGWSSILYLAVLSRVDPEQHEAAVIDGASRLKRIWYINIPVLLPTMVMILIINAGSIMSVVFENVYLMQKDLIIDTADVISTYVYRRGLIQGSFSFAAAVGLFNNVVNFILLILVNGIAKRFGDYNMF